MPPRNAPLPNAVNLFHCGLCDKGYPRQTDYENHLRSYDHNHRQRLGDMKKMTDANASDVPRLSKGPLDMRTITLDDRGKKGLGPRFKKIGGAAATTTGGSRFKKVGVTAGDVKEEEKKADKVKEASPSKVDIAPPANEPEIPVADAQVESQVQQVKNDEDAVMADADEEEVITWEEYDFTKPSECDHANCPGCAVLTDPVYEDGWLVLGSA